MDLICEALDDAHDLSSFDCGKPDLNDWLRRHARHADAMRTARTFVWHKGDGRVCAYFSLSAHLIRRTQLPKKAGRGSPDVIPALMLGKLALDSRLHGQGLGGELLVNALERAHEATRHAGARFVVVEAVDEEAVQFYEHFGFTPIPGPNQLVQKLSSIEAALHDDRHV